MAFWNAMQATVNVFSGEFSLKAQVKLLVSQTISHLKQQVYNEVFSIIRH